jgi:hypothetical protein
MFAFLQIPIDISGTPQITKEEEPEPEPIPDPTPPRPVKKAKKVCIYMNKDVLVMYGFNLSKKSEFFCKF